MSEPHTSPLNCDFSYIARKMIIIGGEPEQAYIADLMFRHGTQTIDNSKICHCLLFHEQNFVQPFYDMTCHAFSAIVTVPFADSRLANLV